MDAPRYLPREAFEAFRGDRGLEVRFAGLWAAGDPSCLRLPCVAVVGTRAATPYGRRLARTLATDLVRAGCCVVSGLALGIDASAHEGALDGEGLTAGVLGGGHGAFFPRRNLALAGRIVAAGGVVLSPFAPEEHAVPQYFLQRNGIVAALADAVVVVEAPRRSGALNTASWAAGRVPVFAVPADVDRPHSQGCLALLRDGATLARDAADVLDVLGLLPKVAPRASSSPPADPLARSILERLHGGECDFDTLAAAVTAEPAAVLAALAMLELDGRVESRGGGRYATLAR